MANWAKRSARRTSFGDGKEWVGSKSVSSAANRQEKAETSKEVMLWMPHLPAKMFSQKTWNFCPREETTPNPVTTTLRSVQLLAIKKGQRRSRPLPWKEAWR